MLIEALIPESKHNFKKKKTTTKRNNSTRQVDVLCSQKAKQFGYKFGMLVSDCELENSMCTKTVTVSFMGAQNLSSVINVYINMIF